MGEVEGGTFFPKGFPSPLIHILSAGLELITYQGRAADALPHAGVPLDAEVQAQAGTFHGREGQTGFQQTAVALQAGRGASRP